ncbi:MAG: glycosyltransferase [Pirellulaceae bacterium]|nr:glycosyltransferase [Pirellulaceae bacterium]
MMPQELYIEPSPRILIDAIFFRFLMETTGVARFWQTLFSDWSREAFSKSILVLDRDGTWPKINGIASVQVPPFDEKSPEADSRMLQSVCDQVHADLFVSTYYSSPIYTPSLIVAYDMIPEQTDCDLQEPMWREKHRGIRHATAAIAISHNTARDLERYFPQHPTDRTVVAYPGVDPKFEQSNSSAVDAFRARFGITRNYVVLMGARDNYKNAIQLFKAIERMPNREDFEVVCVSGEPTFHPDLVTIAERSVRTYLLRNLSDEEIIAVYSGAVALAYPSRYEGFGLPPLEAMACGCPVITTRCGSLQEVCGDAALYVDPDSVGEMIEAIEQVQIPAVRQHLQKLGRERSKKYSWQCCAEIVRDKLLAEAMRVKASPTSVMLKEARQAIFHQQNTPQDSHTKDYMSVPRVRCRSRLRFWQPNEELRSAVQAQELLRSARLVSICRDEPPMEEESDPVREASEWLQHPNRIVHAILLSMMYGSADRLPRSIMPTEVPEWLMRDFANYLFDIPLLFANESDAQRYVETLEIWLSYAERQFRAGDSFWIELVPEILKSMRLTGLLSIDRSLRAVTETRGGLLELHMRQLGFIPDHPMGARPERTRIKLGILMEPLGDHPASQTALALLSCLDRSKFEVVVYVRATNGSKEEMLCRQMVDHFCELLPTLKGAVLSIRKDDLDVMIVDFDVVSRLSPMAYLAAHRLARLQTSTFTGYSSTGFASCDQDFHDANHGESMWESRLRHQLDQSHPPNFGISRSMLGIAETCVVFGSGASVHKLSPQTRAAFIQILSKTPNSVLLLFPFSPGWTDEFPIQRLFDLFHQELACAGVHASRLQLIRPLSNRAEAAAFTKLCDIYLDPFPHIGGASLIDAILSGLPIVAMDGTMARNQLATSILNWVALDDCVFNNREEYVARAVGLGNSSELRMQHATKARDAVLEFATRSRHEKSDTLGNAIEDRVRNDETHKASSTIERPTTVSHLWQMPVIVEPVLLIIYNRPDVTRQVFESIRAVRPRQLFIAADGPKTDRHGDQELCQAARSILTQIDWECDVQSLLRPKNLGCKLGVSSAIDWFFSHVESGIILEDDCVASPCFFAFCQELLEHYRNEPKVMMISGNNFQFGPQHADASYYFSIYSHIWGWATWRRAWSLYDVAMKTYSEFFESKAIQKVTDRPNEQKSWLTVFQNASQGMIDTWDIQWLYAHFYHGGLSVMPNVNLVSNIGFDENATHTQIVANPLANLPRGEIGKIRHPSQIIPSKSADSFTRRYVFDLW